MGEDIHTPKPVRIILFACVALCFLLTATAYPCSCGIPDIQEEVDFATAVFVGKVVKKEPRTYTIESSGGTHYLKGYTLTFNTLASWKGSQNTIQVRTGTGGGDCGITAEIGEIYLVYAHRRDDGQLWMDICSNTVPWVCAEPQIKILGAPSAGSLEREELKTPFDTLVEPLELEFPCMTVPKLIKPIPIEWSDGSMNVYVDLVIGADGTVSSLTFKNRKDTKNPCNPACSEAFLNDLKRKVMNLQFQPSTMLGKPVSVIIHMLSSHYPPEVEEKNHP